MNLLTQLLQLRGIESIDKMSGEEKAMFTRWQEVFNKEVTIETVTGFIESQLPKLQHELLESTKNGEDRRSLLITAKIENYQSILAVIRAVELEKQQVEAELQDLIANHNV